MNGIGDDSNCLGSVSFSIFNTNQLYWVNLGRSDAPRYGDISDLDPAQWDDMQMEVAALGRGSDPEYGDVSHLDPSRCDAGRMEFVSKGLGCNPAFGDVSDLDQERWSDPDCVETAAVARGCFREYGTVDDLDPCYFSSSAITRISRYRGCFND